METVQLQAPAGNEIFDRTVFRAALVLMASGVAALVAMMALLFPEWFAFHSYAPESTAPAV